MNHLISQRKRRSKRVRARIKNASKKPRLSVFRSNRYIYGQIIEDVKGMIVVSASEKELSKKDDVSTKTGRARMVGALLAQKAKKKRIVQAVFDRGRYAYAGRVKALAEGAREGGLLL